MSNKKINLLILDDSEDDRQYYKRLLRYNKDINKILEAESVDAALEIYRNHRVDCALIDYRLPGDDGIDFIKKLNKSPHDYTPIIMITGYGNERIAVDAMKAGAADYLPKSGLSEEILSKTIAHIMDKGTLLNRLKEKTIALELIATTDYLTGLMNRRAFRTEVKKCLAEARRNNALLCFLFIDLDDFKRINDIFTHEIGDKLLALAASRLKRNMREEDILCRFGGDEFIAVAKINEPIEATSIAKKIIATLSKQYNINSQTFYISASIGIAYSATNKSLDTSLHEADLALHKAKQDGKSKFAIL